MKKLILLSVLVAALVVCRKTEESSRASAVTPAPSTLVAPGAVLGAAVGLKEPRGVGVNANGHIFVGDSGNQRVVRMDAAGRVLGSWGGWASETILSDVAVTPDGEVATVDVSPGDVQVFGPTGKPVLRVSGACTSASGITIGPDGRIWVADTGQSRVLRFTRDGKPDGIFAGTSNSAHLKFEQPIDVAVAPDGTAYVVDLRRRIMRLAADGGIAAEWRMECGSSRGGSHLAVWQGLVVMTDPDRHRLSVLDPASGAVRFVGELGTGPGQFRVPVGIAASVDNKLYVVDSGNARVQVFGNLGK